MKIEEIEVNNTFLSESASKKYIIHDIKDGWVYFHLFGEDISIYNSDIMPIADFKKYVLVGVFN